VHPGKAEADRDTGPFEFGDDELCAGRHEAARYRLYRVRPIGR
jgi:hypothetical protein